MEALWRCCAGERFVGCILGLNGADAKTKDGKYLIYYSMSYVGNAWQAEAKNAITAMSKTAAYRDKVELRVQASGANAQRQIEQINAMIQAGADAIVAFPISPTALNGVIKTACEKKVVFVAVNGVTEPCAYNVKIDGVKHGAKQAKWVFRSDRRQGQRGVYHRRSRSFLQRRLREGSDGDRQGLSWHPHHWDARWYVGPVACPREDERVSGDAYLGRY